MKITKTSDEQYFVQLQVGDSLEFPTEFSSSFTFSDIKIELVEQTPTHSIQRNFYPGGLILEVKSSINGAEITSNKKLEKASPNICRVIL